MLILLVSHTEVKTKTNKVRVLNNRHITTTSVKHEVYFFGIKTIFQFWISYLTQANTISAQGIHQMDKEKPKNKQTSACQCIVHATVSKNVSTS